MELHLDPYRGRRIRELRIEGEMVVGWFRRGMPAADVVANPLPDDARIIEARFDNWTGSLHLLIESDTYEPLPAFCVPLVLTPPEFTAPGDANPPAPAPSPAG